MRAPSAVQVDFPLGPERRWQLMLTAAFVLFLLTQLIWWLAQAGTTTPLSTLSMAALLCLLSTPVVGRALWRLRQPRARALRWTGQTWQLIAPDAHPQLGDVSVALDQGDWLLLRHRGEAGDDQWLPMAARRMPNRWHALRFTLASQADSRAKGRRDAAA